MLVAIFSLTTITGIGLAQQPEQTAIDHYIQQEDSSYSWKVVSQEKSEYGTLVVIDMVSQSWRSADEVDRTLWQHWLTMVIPEKPASDTGLLFIGGGKNDGNAPDRPSSEMQKIAAATNTVVAELKMVPNQPLVFHGDGKRRSEDDLIAYTWDQFLKTGEPNWLARNAMVKSAVRAMDTMTAAVSEQANGFVVNKFVVAGASKRGWTTWLTGAIDERVVAIVPIVIDVLNTEKSMRHHFKAYGYWAPAVGNYVEQHIMERFDHPRMSELLALVDPFSYRHRLSKPKLILNASGDQFFLPDSWRFYWDELPGEKLMRYVPNADHSLRNTDAFETLLAFYQLVISKAPRPQLNWQVKDSELIVSSTSQPDEVLLWKASNPAARDFRVETLGKQYSSVKLEASDGSYRVALDEPENGWAAYFVEFTFGKETRLPLKLSTGVYVVPDVLPYEEKSVSDKASVTIKCRFADSSRAAEVLSLAKVAFKKQLRVKDLLTEQLESTIYVNWVPRADSDELRSVLGWFSQQSPLQVNIQLESGRGITTTSRPAKQD